MNWSAGSKLNTRENLNYKAGEGGGAVVQKLTARPTHYGWDIPYMANGVGTRVEVVADPSSPVLGYPVVL